MSEATKTLTLKKTQDWKLPTSVLDAALADDENAMIAGCMDGVYRLQFEPHQEELLYQHESYVSSVGLLKENQIVSAGYDGGLRWFDVEQRKLLRTTRAHDFWSWDMSVSADRSRIASVTGQYLAGSYKYEPQPEKEPSLKVFAADSGDLLHQLPHIPSTQAVAISPDNRFVAAGNLMGEVRVFDLDNGQMAANWTTPDFTSWGIIKSHCYLGGIFDLQFTPDSQSLLLCGMGPMRDPMAGNGRQLWQRWDWKKETPTLLDQTHQGQSGEGLMETLAIHPRSEHFAMGGRLRGGDWNLALFDLDSGNRIASAKTGFRITRVQYTADGKSLFVAGTQGQPKPKKDDSPLPPFGRVERYEIG
ncbi:MAG: hypothetical protein GY904_21775 [Planctomycetaceae bacterium]|nr:hypothetical protein [Planctomycetaceae bacterium]